ncbi:hypothetical protein [Actinospica robiniae]|uniref:hypothetical protein n=1 Tax=Actinospica robiniae TaxID=304901 RepID=UPI0003F92660|nr:hypothetical protein [Actinospica robiniae]
MDLTSVVMPGAQSLVTAILTDSWSQVRAALSRLWARRRPEDHASASSAAALEAAGAELDLAREQALAIAGQGSESERAGRMELFWAGYLAGQLAARPELSDAMKALPALLTSQPTASFTTATTTKTISGTVHGGAVQADDVSGGISFGR